jgi:hypothetical protein
MMLNAAAYGGVVNDRYDHYTAMDADFAHMTPC